MNASVSTEPISRIQVGDVPVLLEQTSLPSVQAKLGGVIGHRGDAGESLHWLCYRHVDGDWILWLMSGEIHGDTIGGFLLRELRPDAAVDPRCVSMDSSLQLPGPVETKMSREAFVKALGAPTADRGDTIFYLHGNQGATLPDGRVDPDFVTYSSLIAIFSSGQLTAIEVWRATAN